MKLHHHRQLASKAEGPKHNLVTCAGVAGLVGETVEMEVETKHKRTIKSPIREETDRTVDRGVRGDVGM